MSQQLKLSLTSLFLLPLFLVACQSGPTEQVKSSQAPEVQAVNEVSEEQPVVEEDGFGEAVNSAMAASEAAQTAQTADEWSKVTELWGNAIELMQAVPETSENYQTAQQKVEEYQPNLEYAQKNAAMQVSSAPQPEVKPISTESAPRSAGSKVLINLVETSSDEIGELIPLAAQVADQGTLRDYTQLDAVGRGLVTMTILNSWIVDGKTTKSLTLEEEQAIITDLTLALSEAAKSYPSEPVFGAATSIAKVTNIVE